MEIKFSYGKKSCVGFHTDMPTKTLSSWDLDRVIEFIRQWRILKWMDSLIPFIKTLNLLELFHNHCKAFQPFSDTYILCRYQFSSSFWICLTIKRHHRLLPMLDHQYFKVLEHSTFGYLLYSAHWPLLLSLLQLILYHNIRKDGRLPLQPASQNHHPLIALVVPLLEIKNIHARFISKATTYHFLSGIHAPRCQSLVLLSIAPFNAHNGLIKSLWLRQYDMDNRSMTRAECEQSHQSASSALLLDIPSFDPFFCLRLKWHESPCASVAGNSVVVVIYMHEHTGYCNLLRAGNANWLRMYSSQVIGLDDHKSYLNAVYGPQYSCEK